MKTIPFTAAHTHIAYIWNYPSPGSKRDRGDHFKGRVRLGSIRNKNNWNNASKRAYVWELFSFRNTRIPFWLFCSQEQNSRNIFRNTFLFRNIPKRTHPKC